MVITASYLRFIQEQLLGLFALCGAHFSQVIIGCQPYYAINDKYYRNILIISLYPLLDGLFGSK